MRNDDLSHVRHMLGATREATSAIAGKKRSDLERNPLLVRSLVRCAEDVGEAATHVTDDARRHFPGIPWTAIVAMRKRLMRPDFAVELDRVWDTVVDDLPHLTTQLEEVVRQSGKK